MLIPLRRKSLARTDQNFKFSLASSAEQRGVSVVLWDALMTPQARALHSFVQHVENKGGMTEQEGEVGEEKRWRNGEEIEKNEKAGEREQKHVE